MPLLRLLSLVLSLCLVLLTGPVLAQSGPHAQGDEDDEELWEVFGSFRDDLEGLRQRRMIRVAITYSRTNYSNNNGEIDGFDYRVLKLYEDWLNHHRPHGSAPISFVFMPMPLDELVPALEAGHADIASAFLTATVERARKVAFSQPILTGVTEIVVTASGTPAPADLAALAGMTFHQVAGSSYIGTLGRLNEQLRARKLKPVEIRSLDDGVDTEDVLRLVAGKRLPITLADRPLAEIWQHVYPGLQLHPGLSVDQPSDIAIAVRQDAPHLLASLNEFLASLPDGRIAAILKEFGGKLRAYEDERSASAKANAALLAIIRDESKALGLDWRLVAALVMKESGFDPKAKNATGAQGLMQLMPQTAAAMGVHNPFDPAQNIRGGVRYLSELRDRYFADADLDDDERWRFVLAGFNGGPNRINRLRAKAGEVNLKPNIYFNHVEQLVLKRKLYETFAYVRQVQGYYHAYKTEDDEDELPFLHR